MLFQGRLILPAVVKAPEQLAAAAPEAAVEREFECSKMLNGKDVQSNGGLWRKQ
jgi:hypothetical protein